MATLNPTQEEIAYAAGFFDGEGHIAISRTAKSKCVNKYGSVYFYERYQMHIQVSQKDRTPIIWLKEKFGGLVHHGTCKRSYDKQLYHKWTWMLNSINAMEFLKLIKPFLLTKRQEADVAIEFQSTINRANRGKNSPEVMQFRRDAAAKIRLIRAAK